MVTSQPRTNGHKYLWPNFIQQEHVFARTPFNFFVISFYILTLMKQHLQHYTKQRTKPLVVREEFIIYQWVVVPCAGVYCTPSSLPFSNNNNSVYRYWQFAYWLPVNITLSSPTIPTWKRRCRCICYIVRSLYVIF